MGEFDNKASAKENLLVGLKEKYGENFEVAGEEKFRKTGFVYVYSCKVIPIAHKEELFSARVTSAGDYTDNYSVYEFYDEMISLVDCNLKDKKYIESYEIVPTMGWTSVRWDNSNCSLQAFLEESKAYDEIIVVFSDEKTEEQILDDIYDLVSAISGSTCPIRLNIKQSDQYIFTEKFESNAGILSKEEIKEQMESTKRGRLIETE